MDKSLFVLHSHPWNADDYMDWTIFQYHSGKKMRVEYKNVEKRPFKSVDLLLNYSISIVWIWNVERVEIIICPHFFAHDKKTNEKNILKILIPFACHATELMNSFHNFIVIYVLI